MSWWSGESSIAIQPSQISAPSAMFFGPSAARKIGMSSRSGWIDDLSGLPRPVPLGQRQRVVRARRRSPGPRAPRCRAGSRRTRACGRAASRTASRTSPRRPAGPETPMPRINRPPERWSSVIAAIAVAAGWRADICMIPVPSLTFLVCEPHQASGVRRRSRRPPRSRSSRSRGCRPPRSPRPRPAAGPPPSSRCCSRASARSFAAHRIRIRGPGLSLSGGPCWSSGCVSGIPRFQTSCSAGAPKIGVPARSSAPARRMCRYQRW